ncbi:MAG: TRAP transporter small permease subunit [Lacisediminimonas sp.]|nr:TRAP transporter small permease subunit [Lacisediminimonas sp.]
MTDAGTRAGPVAGVHRVRVWLNRTFDAAGAAAGTCVLLIFILMIGGAVGRALSLRVGAVNDIASWLCAAAAFFAMAHAFKHGDFVRVSLLIERLPARARRVAEASCLALAAVSTGYLSLRASMYTWHSFVSGDVAGGLVAMPMWIPQSAFVIGAWLLLLAVLDELVLVLQGRKPTYQQAVEERHARGDFSADI